MKMSVPRFSGKFEPKSVHHPVEMNRKKENITQLPPVLCPEKIYFDKSIPLDFECITRFHILWSVCISCVERYCES